jgi:hypothetical protein
VAQHLVRIVCTFYALPLTCPPHKLFRLPTIPLRSRAKPIENDKLNKRRNIANHPFLKLSSVGPPSTSPSPYNFFLFFFNIYKINTLVTFSESPGSRSRSHDNLPSAVASIRPAMATMSSIEAA